MRQKTDAVVDLLTCKVQIRIVRHVFYRLGFGKEAASSYEGCLFKVVWRVVKMHRGVGEDRKTIGTKVLYSKPHVKFSTTLLSKRNIGKRVVTQDSIIITYLFKLLLDKRIPAVIKATVAVDL